jgi:hypothetical protein
MYITIARTLLGTGNANANANVKCECELGIMKGKRHREFLISLFFSKKAGLFGFRNSLPSTDRQRDVPPKNFT